MLTLYILNVYYISPQQEGRHGSVLLLMSYDLAQITRHLVVGLPLHVSLGNLTNTSSKTQDMYWCFNLRRHLSQRPCFV